MRRAILVGLLFFLGCEGGKSTPDKVPRYARPAVTITGSMIYTLGKKIAPVVGDDVSMTTARQAAVAQARQREFLEDEESNPTRESLVS